MADFHSMDQKESPGVVILKIFKQRRGFIQIGLAAILIIAALVFIGPAIKNKLEVIGISDDYIMYDDFEKGYLDDELWEYNPDISDWLTWRVYSLSQEGFVTQEGGVSNGYLNYPSNYQSKPLILTTKNKIAQGMNFKTRVFSTRYYDKNGYGSFIYSSYVSVYMNDVFLYKCIKGDDKGTEDCTIEGIPSFEDPKIYTIRINGNDYTTIDTSNPDGDKQLKFKLFVGEYNSYHSSMLENPAISQIDYIKYKIPYNCKIEDDEILLFDSYAAGSTVNISTLSHEPVKFCLDYPIKARSFEEDGIKTDIRGEILQKIVQGKSTTVPDTEEWKIFYITKQTGDISLRCDIDEAFSTETGLCENPSEQLIVGCQSDADCYIPNGCTGLTCECIDNELVYDGGCIFQPQQTESSMWDKIMSLSLMQWIAGLFD